MNRTINLPELLESHIVPAAIVGNGNTGHKMLVPAFPPMPIGGLVSNIAIDQIN